MKQFAFFDMDLCEEDNQAEYQSCVRYLQSLLKKKEKKSSRDDLRQPGNGRFDKQRIVIKNECALYMQQF